MITLEVANAITASLANGALGHNKDENVIAFDAYNQAETGRVSKTVAARVDQDTASCVAFAQNTRDEVRLFGGDGQIVGALAAQPGVKQTNYVAYPIDTQNMSPGHNSGGIGFGQDGDPSSTLTKGHSHGVAFAIQAGALRTNPASGPDGAGVQADHAYTLEARAEVQAVVFQPRIGRNGRGYSETVFPALGGADAGATSDMRPCVANATTSAVRRLTPVECERLQGFPDGFTAIPWGKKAADECPDGPRYKALGNSMAVPVMRWIGERIQLVDDFVSLL